MKVKVGLGQDSHRFQTHPTDKPLLLAGVVFEGEKALKGNSDSDVVLHAITNAISGITGTNILGSLSDKMCLEQGITDSAVYLNEALKYLDGLIIQHLSISIECKTPKIYEKIEPMKQALSSLLGISSDDIGITATSGEGLTAFGRGEGIQVFSVVTAASE